MKNKLIILIGVLLIIGCNRFDKGFVSVDSEVNKTYEVIEEDQALETLMAFMQRTEMMTKAGKERVIKSINTYPFMTKATDDPEAYVINFEDNAGFAVLGARSDMAEIIAVTENGNIDPVTLSIIDSPVFGDSLIVIPGIPVFGDDEVVVDTLTSDNIYCVEDDDYYIGGDVGLFVQNVIQNGIKYRESPSMPSYGDNDDGGGIGGGGIGGGIVNTIPSISPLLKTNWSQTGLYDDDCDNKAVGCSALALAMILTHNKYPTTLKVNNTTIVWDSICNVGRLTSKSSNLAKTQIPLLIGSVYHKCKKKYFKNRNETLITPRQIEKRFNAMNYDNVIRHKGSDYNDEMFRETLGMLQEYKPVFISAIDGLFNGHSWVIDGCEANNSMLHFNFGWDGISNGYYTRYALNYELYDWHFRVITYDKPTSPTEISVNF